jgi:hypothetical protein
MKEPFLCAVMAIVAGPACAATNCTVTYARDYGTPIAVGEIAVDEKNWLASAKVPLDASYGYTREVTISLILNLPIPPHMEIGLYNNAGKEGRGYIAVPILRPGESGRYTLFIHNHGDKEPSFEEVDADCRAMP